MVVGMLRFYMSERHKLRTCAAILADMLRVLFSEQFQVYLFYPCFQKSVASVQIFP